MKCADALDMKSLKLYIPVSVLNLIVIIYWGEVMNIMNVYIYNEGDEVISARETRSVISLRVR